MTQQKKSGMDKGTIEGMENLKAGEGIEGYEYASSLDTEGTQINDPALGQTRVIRGFEFKMNPEMIKYFPSDRQVLFNNHAKQMTTILWGDGLVPIEDIPPRVIINRKRRTYQIFIPCQAKRDTLFVDKPKSLQEQLKTKRG